MGSGKEKVFALISGVLVISIIALFFSYFLPLAQANSGSTETGFVLLPTFSSFAGFTVLVLLLGFGFYFNAKKKE